MNIVLFYICVFFNLFLIFILLAKKQEKIDFIVNLAESILLYFCTYIITSGILFAFNLYSLPRSVIITFLILVVYSIIALRKNIKNKIKFISFKEMIIPYIAILIILIFSSGSFGFFGMGQDQGVYQTEAINLINNNNNWKQDIDIYSKIESEKYKKFYKEQIYSLLGYDLTDKSIEENFPLVKKDKDATEIEGTWHGIPTFASVLALSSKLFGLQNMPFIQTIFYACLLIVFASLLKNRKVNPILSASLIILLGISPQLFWVKKSTLTECFLALLIVNYLFYLLHPNKNKTKFSVLMIITYCFFHVSSFTLIPIFIINYWLLYCMTKEKRYIKYTKVSLLGYMTGFLMMLTVQPRYTLFNYTHDEHYALSFINPNLLIYFVISAVLITYLITVLIDKKYNFKLNINKLVKNIAQIISIALVIFLFIKLFNNMLNNSANISLITIICYSILSGLILIPIIMFILLTKKYKSSKEMNIIVMMFIWCIIIYSIIMKVEINYYYYYGRYLAPFISIIILLFAEFFKNKKLYYVIVPIFGIIFLFPYYNVIRTEQDDTKIEWKSFTNVLDSIDEKEIVFVDESTKRLFYFPLLSKAKNDVYFVENNNLQETIKELNLDVENVLYLTQRLNLEKIEKNYDVVYNTESLYSEDCSFFEEYIEDKSKFTSLPLIFSYKKTIRLILYRVKV